MKKRKTTYKIETQDIEKILHYRKKGLSLREIGELIKLTPQGVKYQLDKWQKILKNPEDKNIF